MSSLLSAVFYQCLLFGWPQCWIKGDAGVCFYYQWQGQSAFSYNSNSGSISTVLGRDGRDCTGKWSLGWSGESKFPNLAFLPLMVWQKSTMSELSTFENLDRCLKTLSRDRFRQSILFHLIKHNALVGADARILQLLKRSCCTIFSS